ncbi:unnamed protein product [Ceutorhynchus assimilis]|uniref:Uncharacterized protein n=1 Tax=Ceutorhynchus assimilis TaxID=467358 RepID=A0A9N9QIM6_9CUCU|nr:unnamed protein product [Ceutorhynchus assimilis]
MQDTFNANRKFTKINSTNDRNAGFKGPPSACKFFGDWHFHNECSRNPYLARNEGRNNRDHDIVKIHIDDLRPIPAKETLSFEKQDRGIIISGSSEDSDTDTDDSIYDPFHNVSEPITRRQSCDLVVYTPNHDSYDDIQNALYQNMDVNDALSDTDFTPSEPTSNVEMRPRPRITRKRVPPKHLQDYDCS